MEDKPDSQPCTIRAVLLLGPTGSGKTPLGDLLGERGLWQQSCVHFDFGSNLRQVVSCNRPDDLISREDINFLRQVLDSGALLENERFPIAERLLQSFLKRLRVDARTIVVLNGLPRHVGQARSVDAILNVEAVVHLRSSNQTVLKRIRNNVGGDRADRQDDDPEAIRNKLRIFEERTAPMLDHYRIRRARIETIEVTAEMTPEDMWQILNERNS